MPGPHLRPSVVVAREKLAEGRKKLRAQHERGSPGIQVCTLLTDLLDTILIDLYQAALAEFGDKTGQLLALVAHGGYGRREVAPFSDVDLMLLLEQGASQDVAPFVRRLTQSIIDAGLQLGCSVRTPRQACRLALADATIFTSLLESRLLAGNEELLNRFLGQFRRRVKWHGARVIATIEASRRAERQQYGETVYLLEPNVKRSRGGLRDLHLLRWIGFARYGEAEPRNLERLGVLRREDRRKLRMAHEFLLSLRNELHFHAGKSQDVFDKSEQLRLAERFAHAADGSLLPVEQLMKAYIEHTSDVRYVVAHFVASAKRRRTLVAIVDPLFSHRVGQDFRVGPLHIGATRNGLVKVTNNLAEVLRLMDLSNRYDVRIDHPTWEAIRNAMVDRPSLEVSPQAADRFLSLLSQPGRLASLLRRLHELRVLEKLIPPMAHARCLMQFNDYHKFTVDEHSIRAVEAATEFLEDDGPLGEAYRGLRDKRLLHLALLVHDLGKGYPDDHSEVGSRLAEETGRHLGLSARTTETLRFLVHRHLLMSHLAQRRDIYDDAVVMQFAVEVGSAEVLQMLYLLTCADLAAVGPGVLNRWKLELITRLYRQARARLAGQPSHAGDSLALRREELRHQIQREEENAADGDWWNQQIEALPDSYLVRGSVAEIYGELWRLCRLPHERAVSWAKYLPEQSAVEFSIGAYEEITPGIFHKLTGVLTSKGMQILSAEIHTLAGNLVLDRFHVVDHDYSGQPPPERLEEVTSLLVRALEDQSDRDPTFRRVWSSRAGTSMSTLAPLPARVQVDNNTSDRYTVLDIFAHDQMGLLYTIARTIFELELSVHVAKIGTYMDQVVDVFYVTDRQEQKVVDESRLDEIRRRLLAAIENHSAILT